MPVSEGIMLFSSSVEFGLILRDWTGEDPVLKMLVAPSSLPRLRSREVRANHSLDHAWVSPVRQAEATCAGEAPARAVVAVRAS